MELYTTSEKTIERQVSNHCEVRISRITNRKKRASADALRDSINQFLNYWDNNIVD